MVTVSATKYFSEYREIKFHLYNTGLKYLDYTYQERIVGLVKMNLTSWRSKRVSLLHWVPDPQKSPLAFSTIEYP